MPVSAAESGELDGFLSYSREDALAAAALVGRAADRGRALWLDTADLPPATVWRDELRNALQSAHAFVILMSPEWLASPECRREVELAQQFGKRMIPIRLQPLTYDELPPEARSLQWIDASTSSIEEVTERLLSAIDDDYARAREHTRWLERAARWEERGGDRSLLARGRDLRAAEEWLAHAGDDPRPVPLQIQYVAASRRAERRRGRTLLSGISVAAIIALLLAGLALWQREAAVRARDTAESRRLTAESQRLAAESRAELAVDPEVALILATVAWRTARTTQAQTALRQALGTSFVRSTVKGTAGTTATSFEPGLVVAPEGPRGTWLVARRGTRVVSRLDVGAPIEDVAVDARGTVGMVRTERSAVGWALEGSRLVQKTQVRRAVNAAVSQSGGVWAVVDGRSRVFQASRSSPRWKQVTSLPRFFDAYALSLSADGRTLAVGGFAEVAVRRPSGSVRVLKMPNAYDFWLSGDGRHVIGLSGYGRGRIVRVDDGTTIRHLSDAMTAAVSAGPYVAIEGEHGVDLYRIGTREQRRISRQDLKFSTQMTRSYRSDSEREWTDYSGVSFDATGRLLLTWEAGGVPQVWDVRDGRLLGDFPGGRRSDLSGAAFVPGGADIVTRYEDSSARFWEVPDRPAAVPLPELRPRRRGWLGSYTMSSDMVLDPKRGVVTMAGGDWIGTWSTRTGEDLCAADARASHVDLCATQRAALAHPRLGIPAVSPSPDWHMFAVADSSGGLTMYTLDRQPRRLWHLRGDYGYDNGNRVSIRWSPDSSTLVYNNSDHLAVVDARTGRASALADPDYAFPETGVWISGGREIGVPKDPNRLQVNSRTGRRLRTFGAGTGSDSYVMQPAPDGEWLAVAPIEARANVVNLVDVADGRIKHQLWGADDVVDALAVSQDGSFVAAGDVQGGIKVWEADTGALIGSSALVGERDVVVLAFDHHGDLLVGAQDGTVWRARCPACRDGDFLVEKAKGLITLPIAEADAGEFSLTADQLGG